MRRPLIAAILIATTATIASAQGWILPRCGVVIRPTVPIRDCATNIVRTRSDVHVELADRVLRYEVEERFVNRGGDVGEADYLFPLPNDAAYRIAGRRVTWSIATLVLLFAVLNVWLFTLPMTHRM